MRNVYIDPETEQPHIYNHEVREDEVEDVLRKPGEDRPAVASRDVHKIIKKSRAETPGR